MLENFDFFIVALAPALRSAQNLYKKNNFSISTRHICNLDGNWQRYLTKGCKTPGHTQKLYDRLYVIPCTKTLERHYFHKIYMNAASGVELTVHTKQQYYVHYCHKFVVIACKNHYIVQYAKKYQTLISQSIQNIFLIRLSLTILKFGVYRIFMILFRG